MIIVAQLCNFSYLCYMKRRITTYGGYFERFIETLSTKELLKLHYIISLLETEDRMPVKFIKFIRDGLYELRMEYNSNIYRVFFILTMIKLSCYLWFSKENPKDPIRRNRKSIKN